MDRFAVCGRENVVEQTAIVIGTERVNRDHRLWMQGCRQPLEVLHIRMPACVYLDQLNALLVEEGRKFALSRISAPHRVYDGGLVAPESRLRML